MRSRQRLLSAIRGEPVDRVPWSPFLAYYWESLSPDIRSRGQFAYMREMGADPLLRGFHHLVRYRWNNCDIHEARRGRDFIRAYETPVGRLTERYVYSDNGDTTFLVDHPVQEAVQFKILQYMFEHLTMEPDQAAFEADLKACGEDALLLPTIGVAMKTAFQSLVEHWAGTVNLVYALADEPEAVEDCLAAMWVRDEQSLRLSLDSKADGFIFWEDSSTTNISPAYFETYTMPEVNTWGRLIHESGKLLVHHACGHLRDLIPLMATTEIDAIESISPPPTGNITLKEAAAELPGHIALIGGLEPVRLLTGTTDQVIGDALSLLEDMKGRRYVLANSDSCPPGVEYEKFLAVTELINRPQYSNQGTKRLSASS